jgi:uncharacterized protein GlcG (DUF336 family)
LENNVVITLSDARCVIAAAEEGARNRSADGARIGSIDISIHKGFTARAFDTETAQLAKNSQPGQQFFGIHASNNGRVMIFAGGTPLRRGGAIIGAIGVSGGDGNRDQMVASTGAAMFN